jgi:translation initiation factor 1A
LREYQEGKADVIHKYTAEEARNLQTYGELPSNARINVTAMDMATEGNDEDDDDDIQFEDVISSI